MPYYNKQRDKWMAQVVKDGVKHRRQFGTKADAKAWEQSHYQETQETNPVFEMNLANWSEAYLNYSASKHNAKTYSEKKLAFSRLFATVPSTTLVSALHKGTVLSHFAFQAQSRSGNAANKNRKNLIAAWNWAREYLPDFPPKNPFCTERFPEERTNRYVPPEKDFWAVYDTLKNDRDKLMLLCFLHLAARKMEIFRLAVEDVDLERKQVRLATRKRRDGSQHYDWLPMTDRLYLAMGKHLATCSGPWVFPDLRTGQPYVSRQHWLARLCKRAMVKPFGLHGIRHLSASILVANKVNLLDVQTLLRHQNLTTTQRYVHRLESVRNAVRVFDAL
jgi:integrase